MSAEPGQQSEFGDLLRQLEQGDPQARALLIERAQGQLLRRVRQLLSRFPAVHRWENTSDVFQEISLKLYIVLAEVTPRDSKHFLCLIALFIRRKLLDLAERVRRLPKCDADMAAAGADDTAPPREPEDTSNGPQILAQWTEIHNYIQGLPEEQRELFDLLFYDGILQQEAAQILGISYRTLKRRWQNARLAFMEKFGPELFLGTNLGPKG